VFFKHKYITLPTVTPADAIVKAYQDLMPAIQGIRNAKGSTHLEALQRIETTLSPPAQSTTQPLPVSSNRKSITQQRPRVQFSPTVQPNVNNGINADPPRVQEPVEFPRVEDDGVDQVQVKPQSPIAALPRESIADRVKTRRRQPEPEEPSSIAQRVAMRRREFAAPVLDVETGKLLEYRALLKHPRFKEAWSISAANEFGRLAQGVGG
jgi:hypothetical protein